MSTSHYISITFFILANTATQPWCFNGSFSHSDDVYEATYSPDGTKILVASKDGDHAIYDAFNFSLLHTYSSSESAKSAKYSPDGQYIAIGMDNDSVIILDGSTYGFVANIPT